MLSSSAQPISLPHAGRPGWTPYEDEVRKAEGDGRRKRRPPEIDDVAQQWNRTGESERRKQIKRLWAYTTSQPGSF